MNTVTGAPSLPKVAIVGYPNVGKSTLFNRLVGSREAVVSPTSGVTRDRKEAVAEWGGRRFVVVDTGGIDPRSTEPLAEAVRAQAQAAIAEASVVVFVVDGCVGVGQDEVEIARILRRAQASVILAVNKIDVKNVSSQLHEFWTLGLGEPVGISAEHGIGLGDLLDLLVDMLPGDSEQVELPTGDIKVAIVGRPNVGKSSLVNRLLGDQRVIVSPLPGTTRDAIDTNITFQDRLITLIDTAGLRRPSRRAGDSLEYYSALRTLNALRRANVALVIADSSEGIVDLDLQIAYEAQRAGCATAVLLNKCDLGGCDLRLARERVLAKVHMRPPCLEISCLTGANVGEVLPLVIRLHERYSAHLATSALNRWLAEFKQRSALPHRSGKSLKIFYLVQYDAAPPRFKAMVNSKALVTRAFAYHFENRLREGFEYEGIPLIVDFEGKEERYR